jgi:hypothetical protein
MTGSFMADSGLPWYREVWVRRFEREIVLVSIGGASCGPCNDPAFKDVLVRFKRALAKLAEDAHRKLRTIGVSNDWEVDTGIEFLRTTGPWDEIVVGNNWYNSAIIEHFWMAPNAEPAIPQVVVFERSFEITGQRFVAGPKRDLLRLVGKEALESWLASGGALEESSE